VKLLRVIGQEIVGLFLDDEFLAVAALIVVGAVAVLVKVFDVAPIVSGSVLVGGCVGILAISVWRTAHSTWHPAEQKRGRTQAR
jgi:hypothetical protein